jgi:hypothetical protein
MPAANKRFGAGGENLTVVNGLKNFLLRWRKFSESADYFFRL